MNRKPYLLIGDTKENNKVLAKAGIQDTPEMNQKIAEKILEDAKKVTAENTSIESRFKGTKKDVIIESKWIPNIEGPYCTTIKGQISSFIKKAKLGRNHC